MPDSRIIFNGPLELTLKLKNRDISDFAYILGLFLENRKGFPLDATSDDLAEKFLKEMPTEIIKEIERYHGKDFFGNVFK